jgi:hypothetical protein
MDDSIRYLGETPLRAKVGAEFLDARLPGWADKITHPVSIQSCTNCVLGQLFGHYDRGKETFALSGDRVFALGFASTIRSTIDLNAAWEAEITARKTPQVEWQHREAVAQAEEMFV